MIAEPPLPEKHDDHPAPFRRLVTIGESTTAGGSATARSLCWPSLLAELIGQFQDEPVELINVGIGGNVISPRSPGYRFIRGPTALERFRRDVVAHAPDLVVVSYGLNDMRCGMPLDQFVGDLERLVDEIRRGTGALIVLLGVYFMTGYDRYGPVWDKGSPAATAAFNAAVQRVAAQRDLLYADVFAAQGMAPWVIDPDGVHPNNLGHRLIANRIFEILATHCSGLARKALDEAANAIPWRDESVLGGKDFRNTR